MTGGLDAGGGASLGPARPSGASTAPVPRSAAFFLGLVLAAGCSSPPTDETPSGAVRLFLDAIWSSESLDADDDRVVLTTAYELLDHDSRDHLTRDARLAGALGGRTREPWEMLAAGASRMVVVPRRNGGMREVIDPGGQGATVTVTGEDGTTADVRLVLEDGRWRVMLEVPDRGE